MAQEPTQITKRTKRSYSDAEIGNALAMLKSNDGNLLRTANQLGIPYHTLREWGRNKRRDSAEVRNVQHQKEREIIRVYVECERAYLYHALKPEVIAATKGLDAVKAAGIARDKQQLLLGQPTSITATIDRQELSVSLRATLDELLSESSDPLDSAKNVTPTGPERPQGIVVFQG